MINKQPTSLRWVFSHHYGTVSSAYCRIDRTIHKVFVYISQSFSRPFRLKHSRDKRSAFPLNSLSDALIVFHPYGICKRWQNRCKTYRGVGNRPRVVLTFPQRAKWEREWKSPNARKAFLAWGVFHARSRSRSLALLYIPEEKWGLLVV